MAFNRIIEVDIGEAGAVGTTFTKLRISFRVTKTQQNNSNRANITIYNMTLENSQKVTRAGNKIILRAGYEDEGAKSLFFGDVQKATTTKRTINRETVIEAYDGLKNRQNNNISVSYTAGTPFFTVFNDFVTVLGYPLASQPVLPNIQYANGFSFVGKVKDGLTQILNYAGKEWSIQNEQLVVLSPNETIIRTGLVLNSNTGLIETPEPLDDIDDKNVGTDVPKRYRVKSLLFPQLSPGADVVVNSQTANGTFKVESVVFTGDNWEQSFIAESEVVAV